MSVETVPIQEAMEPESKPIITEAPKPEKSKLPESVASIKTNPPIKPKNSNSDSKNPKLESVVGDTPNSTSTRIIKKPITTSRPNNVAPSTGTADNSKIIKEYEITRPVFQKGPKKLPSGFTGYRIEFYSSGFELPTSHQIFSQHGNITFEQKKDGTYGYLLGNFQNEKNAKKFLETVIQPRYKTAKVVRYQNGLRYLK